MVLRAHKQNPVVTAELTLDIVHLDFSISCVPPFVNLSEVSLG